MRFSVVGRCAVPMCVMVHRYPHHFGKLMRLRRWHHTPVGVWRLQMRAFSSADYVKYFVLRDKWISVQYGEHTHVDFISGGIMRRRRSSPGYLRGGWRVWPSHYPLCVYRGRRADYGDLPF